MGREVAYQECVSRARPSAKYFGCFLGFLFTSTLGGRPCCPVSQISYLVHPHCREQKRLFAPRHSSCPGMQSQVAELCFFPCWPRSKAFFTPQSHEPGSRPWPHRGGSEEFRNTGAWPPDHRLRISGQRPWPVPARSFPGDGRRSCFEPSDQAISKALPAFTCYISWKVARVQKTSGSGVHLGFIFLSFLCVSWM